MHKFTAMCLRNQSTILLAIGLSALFRNIPTGILFTIIIRLWIKYHRYIDK